MEYVLNPPVEHEHPTVEICISFFLSVFLLITWRVNGTRKCVIWQNRSSTVVSTFMMTLLLKVIKALLGHSQPFQLMSQKLALLVSVFACRPMQARHKNVLRHVVSHISPHDLILGQYFCELPSDIWLLGKLYFKMGLWSKAIETNEIDLIFWNAILS